MRDKELSLLRMKDMVRDSASFVPEQNVNPQVRFPYPAWILMIDSSNLTTFSINIMPKGWVEISLFLIYVLPIGIFVLIFTFIHTYLLTLFFLKEKG